MNRMTTAKKKSTKLKRDPNFMAMIGRKGGNRTKKKKGKDYFSRIAKLSHPGNNPDAKRKKYVGGRPPNGE